MKQSDFENLIRLMISIYESKKIGWCQNIQFIGMENEKNPKLMLHSNMEPGDGITSADIGGMVRIACWRLGCKDHDGHDYINTFNDVFEALGFDFDLVTYNDKHLRSLEEVLDFLKMMLDKSYLVEVIQVMEL